MFDDVKKGEKLKLNKTLRNFGIEIWYQTEKFGIRQNFNPSKAKS